MQFFKIRNWEKFQHYRQRNPPWIRLYQSILREKAYQDLPDTCRSHLVGLFLVASQHSNRLSTDQQWLRHELCTKSPIDLKRLAASGWIEYVAEDASNVLAQPEMLAECKHNASLYTDSTETDSSDSSEVQRQIADILAFGEFLNVKLSREEQEKLIEKFGHDSALERIENLSIYLQSTGKRYKSHYATILSWNNRNGGNNGTGRRQSKHDRNREDAESLLADLETRRSGRSGV